MALRQHPLIGAILATALLGTVACGTRKDDEPPAASPSSIASATAGASVAPTETPAATRTNAEAALAGMTDLIERANKGRCPQADTANCARLTLDLANSGTDFDHGLGSYHVKVDRAADTTIVVGRMSSGQWFQYLWGNPQYNPTPIYNPTELPAQVTICAFGSETEVHSYANPSSAKVGTVADGDLVSADQFVLTLPGSIGNAAVNIQGYGWYRITEPAGWVYSKYVAEGPGCELHDELERP